MSKYPENVCESIEKEMEHGYHIVLSCIGVDSFCMECPWDLFQDERTKIHRSCSRCRSEMTEDEQLLASCFVACEAGVL